MFTIEVDGVRETLDASRNEAWDVYGALCDCELFVVVLREGSETIATYEPWEVANAICGCGRRGSHYVHAALPGWMVGERLTSDEHAMMAGTWNWK